MFGACPAMKPLRSTIKGEHQNVAQIQPHPHSHTRTHKQTLILSDSTGSSRSLLSLSQQAGLTPVSDLFCYSCMRFFRREQTETLESHASGQGRQCRFSCRVILNGHVLGCSHGIPPQVTVVALWIHQRLFFVAQARVFWPQGVIISGD